MFAHGITFGFNMHMNKFLVTNCMSVVCKILGMFIFSFPISSINLYLINYGRINSNAEKGVYYIY